MDSKANLSDRIEELEHMNMRLESETETIGEYITLYQTQRQAMKDKFVEKDEIINRISREHGRMQVDWKADFFLIEYLGGIKQTVTSNLNYYYTFFF